MPERGIRSVGIFLTVCAKLGNDVEYVFCFFAVPVGATSAQCSGCEPRRRPASKILALENAQNLAEQQKDSVALEMLLGPELVYVD